MDGAPFRIENGISPTCATTSGLATGLRLGRYLKLTDSYVVETSVRCARAMSKSVDDFNQRLVAALRRR